MHIVLASASPRRRQLLTESGYDFSVQPADVEEVMPPDLSVGDTTLYNARLKATAIAEARGNEQSAVPTVVIGVDTLVALDGASLGKPRDMDDAFDMLSRLNGRIHEVYSGVWAIGPKPKTERGLVEVTRVKFKTFTADELRSYLARIEPLDKAGSYAAQNDGPEGIIECIEGSRSNVIGLPMEALAKMLSKLG